MRHQSEVMTMNNHATLIGSGSIPWAQSTLTADRTMPRKLDSLADYLEIDDLLDLVESDDIDMDLRRELGVEDRYGE
jgi:hypothetical protein